MESSMLGPDVGKERKDWPMDVERINLPLSWGRMCGTIIIASRRSARCIRLTVFAAHIACISRPTFSSFFLMSAGCAFDVYITICTAASRYVYTYICIYLVEEAICSKSGRLRWDESQQERRGTGAAPASLSSLTCYPNESTTFNSLIGNKLWMLTISIIFILISTEQSWFYIVF